jgi:excisionase family DNA binding protein
MPAPAETPELLTADEVAAILRTHPDCVYRLIRAKQLPAVRLGRAVRVFREALDRWIHAGGTPTSGQDATTVESRRRQ